MPTTNEPEKKVNVEIGMFIMNRTTGQIYEVVDLVPSIRPGKRSYVAKCEPILFVGGAGYRSTSNTLELNVDDAIIDDFHKYMVFGNAIDPKRKLDLEQHIVRTEPYFDKKWYIEDELYRIHIHFERPGGIKDVVGVLKFYDRNKLTFTLLDNDASITININDVIDGKFRLERYFTERQVSALVAFNVKYTREGEDWLGRQTATKTPETENATTDDVKEDTNAVTPNNAPTGCDETMTFDAQVIVHPGQAPIVNIKPGISKESLAVLKQLGESYNVSLVTAVQSSNELTSKLADIDDDDIPTISKPIIQE